MFASQCKVLLITILLLFIINFLIGRLASKLIKLNYEDSVALNRATLARNSPITLAITVATFTDKSLILLALIIGPLMELSVLFLVCRILLIIKSKELEYQYK